MWGCSWRPSFSQVVRVLSVCGEAGSEFLAGVVQGLVERAAGGGESFGKDVDGDVVEGDGDEHGALMGREGVADRGADGVDQLGRFGVGFGYGAAVGKLCPAVFVERDFASCQARLRTLTAASSSANLYAQVVKRLSPR